MDVYKHTREAVRVKVKKCDQNEAPDWRKFSIDPQITTLEILYSLLAKAFDIKADFSIKYKAFDPAGNEVYLSVLSDWDLDAAFLRTHNLSIQTSSEPCLYLQIDVKPFTEVKECDPEIPAARRQSPALATVTATANAREIIAPLQQSIGASQKYVQHMQNRLPGLIINQMEKTFSMVQKAFNMTEENIPALPPRPPLSDNEFRSFLDPLGQIQRTDELRKVIFFGGIESGLRRVVWKHILNVYPSGMNGHQRMEYMRRKSDQYHKLRDTWQEAIKKGCLIGELGYVTSMVKKDVLRTDRLHPFYAGSDDNQNIASLFNILTTYALNHPTVSYCQGMSDIASPLLVTMNDEAHAYICFCAIMFRVRGNFLLDGIAMTQKFTHLSEALSYYDPEFWDYLKAQQADDLLFCYRWLLLELKREFPFDDALRMLEVQWSSLKYELSQNELSLFEKEFVPIMETSAPTTASSHSSVISAGGRENAYTKFCVLRRQNSSASLSSLSSSLGSGSHTLDASKHLNQSLDDNLSRHVLTRRQRRQMLSEAHQSLDEAKIIMLIENEQRESNSYSATNCVNSAPATARVDDNHSDAIHFQFHPTNPFKDDAQQQAQSTAHQTSAFVTDRKSIARVFLNSSSSSIAEDDTELAPELPSSIAKLRNKNILSNYNTVSNIIAKQLSANANSVSETMKRVSSSSGGHFKELKEKIAASNMRAPMVQVCSRSSSLENSDSTCSIPDTTWSNSTGATAIQQAQSLNLELTSQFSNYSTTPDRTPAGFSPMKNELANDVLTEEESSTVADAFKRELRLESDSLNCPVFSDATNLPEVILPISTDDAFACDAVFADPVEFAANVFADEDNEEAIEKSSQKQLNGLPLHAACGALTTTPDTLPPPHIFGGGNPFLMFLCVTLLLQHREIIMKRHLDYNEIAMHFDKMVRRHDVTRVLNQARRMYIDYLRKTGLSK